jgi:geranyl-CoA carboxylase alpha subunit
LVEGRHVTSFAKILIANRGEIACRIVRTARAMGYRTVAVYSDADARAPHVALADEAVRLGPPPAQESYLKIDALLAAARRAHADAIHPGYGFLSENFAFAQACEDAGLTFIGPPAVAIRAVGNKARAKELMVTAGVPCCPGYHGSDQSDATLKTQARRIGFPLLIKAAGGGGGRGMRLVGAPDDLAQAVERARSEAANAFGSSELILEKAVVDARHVEIQVFADAHGNVVHLGERDCSIQRRHQKVIEEAPSPAVSSALREQMGKVAIAAARAVAYIGAGTVEFLLDPSGAFYFIEMNARLQVEHPVTEAITGLDLVAWQLRVAAGETLPLAQQQIRFDGHAIEARLYAEDPYRGFLPQSGTVIDWRPAGGAGIRVDHGLRSGQTVSPFYDPMLAKVIAHGASREEARRRLIAALEDSVLLGIETNRGFLAAALRHEVFAAGKATTAFVEKYFAPDSAAMRPPAPDRTMLGLACVLLLEAIDSGAGETAGWFSTGAAVWPMRIKVGEADHAVAITTLGKGRYGVALGAQTIEVEIVECRPGLVRFATDGLQQTARYACADGALHLDLGGVVMTAREAPLELAGAKSRDGAARLVAPMNGLIIAVLAKAGDRIAKGQRILVLEAMKMQHEIAAERDGTIAAINVKQGDQVATRQLLAVLAAEPADQQRSEGST